MNVAQADRLIRRDRIRSRRPLLERTGTMVALALLAACSDSSGPPELPLAGKAAGDNLLVVTIDTTRADRLGCYGYEKAQTPTLDRLAGEGVRVERALTVTPVTLPSHTSLLSGLLPVDHGVHDNGLFQVDPATPMLAEVLADEGYTTAAFVSAFVLHTGYGISQGFEVFDDRMLSGGGRLVGELERRAADTVDAVLAWMAEDRPEPWFVWMHLYDPHFAYDPPPPFDEGFEDPYDGELAYADAELGRLLEGWDQDGRLDRTLVVVTSDHGEGLGSHGESSHGVFVYDSTLWVPMILRHPSLGQGRRLRGQVSVVDMVPTILELLGVAGPELTGQSFLTALEASVPEVWHDAPFENLSGHYCWGIAPLEGISDAGHKYIYAPREELYDWRADPEERDNRIDDDPETAARLRDLWLSRRVVDPMTQGPNRAQSDEEAARLAELGYVQADGPATLMDPKDYVRLQGVLAGAEDAANRGQFAEAEGILRGLLKTLPNDFMLLRSLGRVCLATGRKEEGVMHLERALIRRPDDFHVAKLLAEAMREDGRNRDALGYYEKALSHDPCNVRVALDAASLALRLKETAKARWALEGLEGLTLEEPEAEEYQELLADVDSQPGEEDEP